MFFLKKASLLRPFLFYEVSVLPILIVCLLTILTIKHLNMIEFKLINAKKLYAI